MSIRNTWKDPSNTDDWPHPRVSHSGGLGWGETGESTFLASSQVMLMLLVSRPVFENHWQRRDLEDRGRNPFPKAIRSHQENDGTLADLVSLWRLKTDADLLPTTPCRVLITEEHLSFEQVMHPASYSLLTYAMIRSHTQHHLTP